MPTVEHGVPTRQAHPPPGMSPETGPTVGIRVGTHHKMLRPVRLLRNADIRIGGHCRAAPGAPETDGPPPMTDNPVWSSIVPSAGKVPDRQG